MPKFKAYRTFEENGVVSSRFVDMAIDELDHGDVIVKTKYSTINYKDALSYNGTGKIMRKYPTNAGIDMAGTVEASGDPRFKAGDKVIVTGYDMGVAHDGGYAERVRVPADWVVRRPESMTAFDAMTLGTAGFTAALAIMHMQHNGSRAGVRAGRGDGRDRRRGLGRGRDPREARPSRRRDHGQGRGGRLPQGHRRQGSRAAAVARPDEDPSAGPRDVRRRDRQPGRRHPRLAAVDAEGGGNGRRPSGSRRATSSTRR